MRTLEAGMTPTSRIEKLAGGPMTLWRVRFTTEDDYGIPTGEDSVYLAWRAGTPPEWACRRAVGMRGWFCGCEPAWGNLDGAAHPDAAVEDEWAEWRRRMIVEINAKYDRVISGSEGGCRP